MSGFFTKTHEAYPEPVKPEQDYSYCTGSIDNVSFSGLMQFEKCPYSLFLDRVSRIPRVSGPAADRGSQIHDLLEQYVQGEIGELKWSIMKQGLFHKELIDKFRIDYSNGLVITELKYAITKTLKPVDWDDKDMWHRGAIDLTLFETTKKIRATIFDYKTGQMNKSVVHRSQLMLYALMLFNMYPDLQEIQASPLYLDHKAKPFYTTFMRKDFDTFWPRWEARFNQVTDATVFPARPNAFNCKWCQHRKAQPDINQVEPACSFGVT